VARVLVVNCGSSSVKYQLLDLADGDAVVLARGLVERVGEPEGRHRHETADGPRWESTGPVPTMAQAFAQVQEAFAATGRPLGVGGLDAIGHRVVHGGERYVRPTVLTPEVVAGIRSLVPLAPLHNPANLAGIEVTLAAWPDVAQVAVFDTAFHQTLPPHAYLYALPYELYEDDGVRRYGFHGTSHAYVSRRAADGDERAILARAVFAHRARKYVGAYAVVLGRLDAVVFTGGIGENDAELRAAVLEGTEALGVVLDLGANAAPGAGERVVSAGSSRVAVLVVPTDEELEIARQTLAVVEAGAAPTP
jgi:acetate kinase